MRIVTLIILSGLVSLAIWYFYPGERLGDDAAIDRLLVLKSERKMVAFSGSKKLKTYRIALGGSPVGHKQFEGDQKTPEGMYTINERNPNSGYHKNLGVSYPNQKDIAFASAKGKPAGGDIKIHGLRNGRGWIGKFHRFKDWTLGCIAVTDAEIDELYRAVKDGAVIEIRP